MNGEAYAPSFSTASKVVSRFDYASYKTKQNSFYLVLITVNKTKRLINNTLQIHNYPIIS